MDDDQRDEIMRRAIYNVGEGREQQEREHARWLARRDPTAEDAAQRWARLRAQSIEPPKKPAPQPKQREPQMTEMQVRAHVTQRLDELVAVIGDETGKADAKLAEQIRQLRIELVELKAELHDMRGERSDDVVLDLPNWRSDVVQH
jgi:hypothetical protein